MLGGIDGGELVVIKKRGVEYNVIDNIPVDGIEGRLGFEDDKLVFVPL